jgi:hypothetical protein
MKTSLWKLIRPLSLAVIPCVGRRGAYRLPVASKGSGSEFGATLIAYRFLFPFADRAWTLLSLDFVVRS